MTNKWAILLIISVLVVSCNDKPTSIQSIDHEKYNFNFPVGEKRIIFKSFEIIGTATHLFAPSLAIFEIKKDTIINGVVGKIVVSTQFEYTKDSTFSFSTRSLLLQEGNQLNIYEFINSNTGYLFDLFKASSFDTLVFSDKMTALEYPLSIGSKWKIRTKDEPNGGWELTKEFLRTDTLEFDGLKFVCDVFSIHLITELTSWISNRGLLKAEINYGKSAVRDSVPLLDSNGIVIDSVTTTEKYELLKINPTDAEIDSIKTKYSKLVL